MLRHLRSRSCIRRQSLPTVLHEVEGEELFEIFGPLQNLGVPQGALRIVVSRAPMLLLARSKDQPERPRCRGAARSRRPISEVTWLQNSRSRSTLMFGGLSANDGRVDTSNRNAGNPIRVYARLSQGFVNPGLISAERAAAPQYQGHALERKNTFCRAEVRLGLNIPFRSPYRWSNRCGTLAGA
jgi:hypothetical protein